MSKTFEEWALSVNLWPGPEYEAAKRGYLAGQRASQEAARGALGSAFNGLGYEVLVAELTPKLMSFFNVDTSGPDAEDLTHALEMDACACAEDLVPVIKAACMAALAAPPTVSAEAPRCGRDFDGMFTCALPANHAPTTTCPGSGMTRKGTR